MIWENEGQKWKGQEILTWPGPVSPSVPGDMNAVAFWFHFLMYLHWVTVPDQSAVAPGVGRGMKEEFPKSLAVSVPIGTTLVRNSSRLSPSLRQMPQPLLSSPGGT